MKIVKQTPIVLALQSLPSSVPASKLRMIILLGFFCLVVPPVVIVLQFTSSGIENSDLKLEYSGIEELACQRVEPDQVDCELTQSQYIGFKKGQKKSLNQVKEARVYEVIDSEGNTSYTIYLSTQVSQVVLYNDKPTDAARINDFVKNPESTSLTIKYDNRWKSIWEITYLLLYMVLGFFLTGLFVYEATTVETYTFDKTFGTLTKTRKILLVTQVKEYPLREIIDVRVKNRFDSDGDFIGYRVSLILTGEQHLTFPSFFSPIKEEEARNLANTIAQFLNLPEPNDTD